MLLLASGFTGENPVEYHPHKPRVENPPAWWKIQERASKVIKPFLYTEKVEERLNMPEGMRWMDEREERKYVKWRKEATHIEKKLGRFLRVATSKDTLLGILRRKDKAYLEDVTSLKRYWDRYVRKGLEKRKVLFPVPSSAMSIYVDLDREEERRMAKYFNTSQENPDPDEAYALPIKTIPIPFSAYDTLYLMAKTPGVIIEDISAKDTTIFLKYLGEVHALRVVMDVSFDTTNYWVYRYSPLGSYILMRKAIEELKLTSARQFDSFSPILNFSAVAEVCQHLPEFKGKAIEVLRQDEGIKSWMKAGYSFDKAFVYSMGLLRPLTPDEWLEEIEERLRETCPTLPEDAYKLFTRGGVIVGGITLHKPAFFFSQAAMDFWNEGRVWDENGIPTSYNFDYSIPIALNLYLVFKEVGLFGIDFPVTNRWGNHDRITIYFVDDGELHRLYKKHGRREWVDGAFLILTGSSMSHDKTEYEVGAFMRQFWQKIQEEKKR